MQDGEENSCYSSENGADNLTPPQETSRSSGGEDLGVDLFPISGCSMSQQCYDYSNSDNDNSQASPSSYHDDDSFAMGKGSNGSNGKPKVYKCRQGDCGFSTISKQELWEHSTLHMKPEKILHCPECQFVTEHKHHLHYHIRNHQGVKEYKCDRCPYSCVNKSMLKSHLKSHSNVYQYSCHDCAYRTKYCHSLKIHLRKYKHEPGTVLDSDGNPNPNPVIDVYGNRRGPKQKPKKGDNGVLPLQPTISPLNAFQNFPWVSNFFPDNSRIPCPMLSSPPILNTPFMLETPKPDIASQETDHLNNNLKITINNNSNRSINDNNNMFTNNNASRMSVDAVVKSECMSEDDEEKFQPGTCLEERSSLSPASSSFFVPFERSPPVAPVAPEPPPPPPESVVDDVPLNLSVSHSTVCTQPENVNTPVVKNRRKGVARKRTPVDEAECARNLAMEIGESERPLMAVAMTATATATTAVSEPEYDSSNELLAKLRNKKSYFYCDYCEITFFNQIMFEMHMGYHCNSDPFTCNRCGKKTEGKIDFYSHMISAAH